MSTRAMAHQYMAPQHGVSTTPQGFDPFGFQERRQARTMTLQEQLQEKVMELEQKHAKELEDLQSQHTKELKSSEQVTAIMQQSGLPDTPANRDRMAQQLTDSQFAQAQQTAKNNLLMSQMQEKSLSTTGSQEASDMGTRLKLSGIPPALLGGTAPMGGISTVPQVPGVNSPLGSALGQQVLKGGTQQTSQSMMGGFPYKDPQTGITTTIGGHPVSTSRTTGGTFSQPQKPISPDEINALTQPQSPAVSTTSQNVWDQDYMQGNQGAVSPMPANNISAQGTPKLSTTPQNMFQNNPNMLTTLLQALFGPKGGQIPYPMPSPLNSMGGY